MTPKEKANELFNKMYDYTLDNSDAKQCALIAVDEIIKELDECFIYSMFWKEVKTEIEKL